MWLIERCDDHSQADPEGLLADMGDSIEWRQVARAGAACHYAPHGGCDAWADDAQPAKANPPGRSIS